jgi:DNA-binding transcriptional MocR family regulator
MNAQALATRVAEDVAAGRRVSGDRLPAVRELARETGCAAGTAARAHAALRLAGIVAGRDRARHGVAADGAVRARAWLTPSPGIPATVEHVSPGPGRWEITLAAPMALRAHVPLGASPPRPGDRLTARLDPALTAILQPSQGLMI